ENALLFGENIAQILNGLNQLFVFVLDLIALETGQLIQTQIENLSGLVLAARVTTFGQARGVANQNADLFDLSFREIECEQCDPGFLAIRRSANDPNEFVEVR